MTLLEINSIIEGKILTKNPDLNLELVNAFSSDVISHIVTYASDKSILITAVYNPQILKTAENTNNFNRTLYRCLQHNHAEHTATKYGTLGNGSG